MPTKIQHYNPDLLLWGAARANKEVEELNAKFPKFNQWLDKSWLPTLKQLESFAKSVYMPFGYLFLSEPPKEELPITFFRSEDNLMGDFTLNLYQTVQTIKDRQEWLREYLKDLEFPPLAFVGMFSLNSTISDVVESIRTVLGVDVEWFREIDSYENTITFLIEKIESVGIMTSLSGTVGGNTHRPISRNEFRGFALIDEYAPFIFVNSNDAKAAQLFTLIHELAHIWLGYSSGTDMYRLLPSDDPIEQFCNSVAAEFLVPKNIFLKQWKKTKNFNILRRYFNVSSLVLARRAFDLELISSTKYFEFYEGVLKNWQNKKDEPGGGGHYFYTARRRIGPQFARYVDSAVKNNNILYRDAYSLVGLKGGSYNRLTKEFI